MNLSPVFLHSNATLPDISSPFLALLDVDNVEWENEQFLCQKSRSLLGLGCRYFVCVGKKAEEIHDRIDDLIVEGKYLDTITTYHYDESDRDIAEFIKYAAMLEMKGLLVLTHDAERWTIAFTGI